MTDAAPANIFGPVTPAGPAAGTSSPRSSTAGRGRKSLLAVAVLLGAVGAAAIVANLGSSDKPAETAAPTVTLNPVAAPVLPIAPAAPEPASTEVAAVAEPVATPPLEVPPVTGHSVPVPGPNPALPVPSTPAPLVAQLGQAVTNVTGAVTHVVNDTVGLLDP